MNGIGVFDWFIVCMELVICAYEAVGTAAGAEP
jgi:hypothetical protein